MTSLTPSNTPSSSFPVVPCRPVALAQHEAGVGAGSSCGKAAGRSTERRDGETCARRRGPGGRPYLVLLVLLQQLTAVAEQLLQAQLGLPALPHALGEVCHQAAGTGEQSLGPPSAQGRPHPRHCSPSSLGKTVPCTGPQFPRLQYRPQVAPTPPQGL